MRHSGLFLAAALLIASYGLARADGPKPEPAALSQLQSMVTNLGYTTTLAGDNQSFSIPWTGDYNYKVHFDLSTDGSLAYAYVVVESYTPGQLAKLDMVKLLEESDIGDFYFSMESISNGESLYANVVLPVSGLTPELLRTRLQNISDKLSDSAPIWDTSSAK